MSRPIPKKLLIHSVTHRYGATEDSWGEPTFEGENNLTRIRIEPTTKRVISKDNTEIQLSTVLFYDCINSKPQNVTFAIEDEILFNGTKYKVQSIEPLYDENSLHHYEVGLV